MALVGLTKVEGTSVWKKGDEKGVAPLPSPGHLFLENIFDQNLLKHHPDTKTHKKINAQTGNEKYHEHHKKSCLIEWQSHLNSL